MLASNRKKKLKQNSDDITRGGLFKRIMKQKPNSFGEYTNKILENKLLTNIIKEFRKDIIEQKIIPTNKENTQKPKKILITMNNNNNNNNTFQKTNYNKTIENININKTERSNNSSYEKSLNEIINNNNFNINISDQINESSENNHTQETILLKPNSISNSLSQSTSNQNLNKNSSNSLLNSSSFNFENHINKNNLSQNQTSNKSNKSNISNLSRSSIIFQPQTQKKSSSSLNSSNSKYAYNPISVLKFHLDTVRDIYIDPNNKILTSVSEDTCLCFWDLERILKYYYKENPEPFLTFRIHTTPIFTLTGPKKFFNSNMNVYSSGIDGVIRTINFPPLNSNNNDDIINKYTLNPWRAHQDMIWELNYHPSNNLLSSVSSDGTVKIFKTYEENKININEKNNNIKHYYSYDSSCKNLVRNFMFRNRYFNFVEIPTSCSWDLNNENLIYVSHIASYIKIYDIETGKSNGDISYEVEKNIPYESQQANKILSFNNSLIVTGHEDRQIRFFDKNNNLMVKNFVAHTDSISCLCNGINEYELLTASHDGTVRCWDLRGGNNKLIFDIPAHRKKYDEGCLSLNLIKSENLMVTSGADGIIKIFKI
jgi:WD40 repeat protein